MADEQDQINVELPRATVGGLKKKPVQELLQRIARDYSALQQENRQLEAKLEHQKAEANGVAVPPAEGLAPESARSSDLPATRVDRDELSVAVLAFAQRAAREMRESTRAECELMIKKSRENAARLESEFERARAERLAELDELEGLKRELREELRWSLRLFLQTFVDRSTEASMADLGRILSSTDEILSTVGESRPAKRKHKNKKP